MRTAFLILALAAACTKPIGPARPTTPTGTLPTTTTAPNAPKITWARVTKTDDVPTTPPNAGDFRIHLIDVGTGLSILVQGHDFTLLYDAGTNDKEEKPSRILAYLARALGPSGDDLCGASSDKKVRIENVVLSHPHFDHASAMDLVVHCYDIGNFYDSGRVNDTAFYRDLVTALAKSSSTKYHTALDVPSDRVQAVKGTEAKIDNWSRFSEGDVVQLGEGARFTLLHADGKKLPDPNQNSVVIAVELGGARLLLVGDAESGERKDPSYPAGDVEEFLIEHHAAEIRADILQVGHHGSKTSSREAFLEAVKPRLALVSSGPKLYGKVKLPDAEVMEALARVGATILSTDAHDNGCDISSRIGGDDGPGGCDSYIIDIKKP